MDVFYILTGVVVTQVCMFIKTHYAVHLKSVHFTDCKYKKMLKEKLYELLYDLYFTHETTGTQEMK